MGSLLLLRVSLMIKTATFEINDWAPSRIADPKS